METLSDEQLIEELQSAANQAGQAINSTQYLMAIRPEPAYVLTSSTTTSVGSFSIYTMPTGYGSGHYQGSSVTQYQYVDANSFARGMTDLAVAISAARVQAFRGRAQEVLAEVELRITRREAEAKKTIADFFGRYPELEEKRLLIAAILPWVASDGKTRSPTESLEDARLISNSLSRGEGTTGRWFGFFSQRTSLDTGETGSFTSFAFVDLSLSMRRRWVSPPPAN